MESNHVKMISGGKCMNNNEINAAWFINKYHCNPEVIKVVMINEVVPEDETDDFSVNHCIVQQCRYVVRYAGAARKGNLCM